MKRLFTILLALAAITSCIDKDPFLYRTITFGYPQSDGSLLADDGFRYIFPTLVKDANWDSTPRVVAIIDVTEQVADSTYKANLVQYTTPVYKKPVVVTDPEIPDTLGTSDIGVSEIWYSGGCLNMVNAIKVYEGSTGGSHVINLMADRRAENADTVKFQVFHRCDYDPSPTELLSEYSFYSSFPVKDLMPKRDSVIIKVSWTWDGKTASVNGKVKI